MLIGVKEILSSQVAYLLRWSKEGKNIKWQLLIDIYIIKYQAVMTHTGIISTTYRPQVSVSIR
jgi:hypothetical protein